jgi:hypothetical protein
MGGQGEEEKSPSASSTRPSLGALPLSKRRKTVKAKITCYTKVFLVVFASLIWTDGLAGFDLFLCMTDLMVRRIVGMSLCRRWRKVRDRTFERVSFVKPKAVFRVATSI